MADLSNPANPATEIRSQIVELARQLNRLKKTVEQGNFEVSRELFTLTLVRGGLLEIVRVHGGKTLRFTMQQNNKTVVLQEFHIPDLGEDNNLRGFLLSANDGTDTLAMSKFEPEVNMDMVMEEFLKGLYTAVTSAFKQGCDVHIQLVKTKHL